MIVRKRAEECQTLAEVREQIDRIDRGIVQAIGERRQFVLAAAAFKPSVTAVAAPDRVASMIQERRRWAEEESLDPDMLEELFRNLVTRFVAQEREHWAKTKSV